MRTPLRLLAGLIGLAVATGGTLLAADPAHAAFVSPLGGPLTRAEVIERAQYWVNHQPGEYSQQDKSPGPTGDHDYRRDCGGLVDMAWHLNADPNTNGLLDYATEIPRSELKAGDILDSVQDHTFLFWQWAADHVHFTYYSFGSTPVKIRTASINDALLDGHPNGDYRAYRYTRIVDDPVRVFARDPNGALWQDYYDGGAWHWQLIGGQLSGQPSMVNDGGIIRVFSRSATGALQQAYYDGAWQWQTIGGTIADGVGATMDRGVLRVFAHDPTGALWQAYYDGAWHWQNVGGQGSGVPGVTVDNGMVRVFTRDPNGALQQAYYDGAWHWQTVGGRILDGVAATVDVGVVHVFARDPNGALWQAFFDGAWHWQNLGGNIAGAPTVRVDANAVRVFARDPNGVLWQDYYDGGAWHWQNLGGNIA